MFIYNSIIILPLLKAEVDFCSIKMTYKNNLKKIKNHWLPFASLGGAVASSVEGASHIGVRRHQLSSACLPEVHTSGARGRQVFIANSSAVEVLRRAYLFSGRAAVF